MEHTAQARELGKPSWEIWETHVAHLRGNRQMRPSYNWAPSPPLPAAQLVQCIMFYGFIYAVYAALKVTTHTHTWAKALRQGKYESKHILMAFQVYLHCPQEEGRGG